MRTVAIRAAIVGAAVLVCLARGDAQRQSAAPITDPKDPKYLTAQTRKMGGPMPAEQMALIFDHLDLALKVFPDQMRIEGVTTLKLKTKAPIQTLILDLFPKFTISEITIDGQSGRVAECQDRIQATVVAGGRLYLFILIHGRSDARAFFDAWVDTIDLRPEDAAVPSTSPSS